MGLGTAIELAQPGRAVGAAVEGRIKPLLHQCPAHAGDGVQAHVEGSGAVGIRPTGTGGAGVGLEQDAGMG